MSYHNPNGSQITATTVTTVNTTTQTASSLTGEGSSNIFAYWADEDRYAQDYPDVENGDYFPNWSYIKETDPGSTPFSYVNVEVGKKYEVTNEFSTLEGYHLQIWYHDSRDAAYGLLPNQDDGWIKGEQVLRGTTVTIEPQGRFLFAGSFAHDIIAPIQPNTYGYELKGGITEVIEIDETPSIENEDLFMIQHEEDLYRISANALKDYFSGIAIGEDLNNNFFGKPGDFIFLF